MKIARVNDLCIGPNIQQPKPELQILYYDFEVRLLKSAAAFQYLFP